MVELYGAGCKFEDRRRNRCVLCPIQSVQCADLQDDMNLNGLQYTPPRKPGFFDRILGRTVENTVIEITNLLAEGEIESVSLPQVADILKRHDLGFTESRPQFTEIYRKVLAHLAQDRELSLEESKKLAHLQMILDLPDEDTNRVREEVLADIYSKSLADALEDGHLSPEKRDRLDRTSASFGLPAARTQAIYKDQVTRLVKLTFDRMTADRRITGDEETRWKAMAENLGVTFEHNAETNALIERFKLLARIEEGDLPVLSPPIKLQRGETCHASFTCTHNEIRTRTTSHRYSGPTASIRIMKGVRWRLGQVAVQRVTREEMVQIDSGTLYVTNKRLLFDGAKKNTVINLSKILHFTVFSDGLKIEKDSGKDQYFLGEGDLEVIGAVLERVVAAVR